ncbi:MAG: glycosyltransferase [Defluviitaleaceae bacterium]|nr:glycosyltransferase [Defluviitaleaceae bacterium]
MCVYNGERYLPEQLKSIYAQTLQASEVLIFDDRSTDRSREVVLQFIEDNKLWETWKLFENETNKGWRLNFYDAILMAGGDIIFFADQDDVWYENKIEVMTAAMKNNNKILTLSAKQHLIDADGNPIKKNIGIKACKRHNFKIKELSLYGDLQPLHWENRIGCAMAIRRSLQERLPNFKRSDAFFAHDIWALNTAAVLGGSYSIDFPAIRYRIHDKNVSFGSEFAPVVTMSKAEKIAALEKHLKYFECLINSFNSMSDLPDKKNLNKLVNVRNFYLKRISLRKSGGVGDGISLVFRYWYFYIRFLGIRTAAADLISPLRKGSFK